MATKGSNYLMPEAQKRAIKEARKGYKPTPETCRKISRALKGHAVTPLTREHISRARLKVMI